MADFFDAASRRVAGAYFLASGTPQAFSADSIERAYVSPWHFEPRHTGDCRLVWTRRGDQPILKEELLDMIRKARRKIFIASFRIGDEDLFEALFEAVERLRGSVYLITLVDQKSLARGHAEGGEEDEGADKQALTKQFGPLVERGIYVRGHESCHAKFIVVDDEAALISSANLEARGLSTTTEIGVAIYNKAEVLRTARFFVRLWHECTWEVAPGSTYTVAQRASTLPAFSSIPPPQNATYALWTHHTEHHIHKAILDTIRRAQGDLLLASYSLNGVASKPELLLSEIDRFRKRTGGRVRLLLRSRNHVSVQRRDAQALAELGCEVFADGDNHAKGVIADGREAILFSANFDAEHGLIQGVEAGVRLGEPRLIQKASAFFEGLLQAAPLRLSNSPTHADLQKLAAHRIKAWPLDRRLRVRAADAEWTKLLHMKEGLALLFEEGSDGRFTLYAGNVALFMSKQGNEPFVRLESGPSGAIDSGKIFEQWLSQTAPGTGGRGVCAAVFMRE